MKTLYGDIPEQLFARFAQVKLLVLDVDGVLSDGRIYMGNQGEELKAFHTKDGYGIKAIQNTGIQVAVITGRNSQIVADRMNSLGVKHLIQGEEHKGEVLEQLLQKLNLASEQVAAMGDDMPDLGLFEHAGLKLTVADGHPYICQLADYRSHTRGGFGAVREVCDLLLQAHDELHQTHGSST